MKINNTEESMNIQMLAASVKMREAWYELSAASKREDENFDLIKHITAEKNKIKPEEVTKDARNETKSSLFASMYFEMYHNDGKVTPVVDVIIDDLLAGMYDRVEDKQADISLGKLLETAGDLHLTLFECMMNEDRNYDEVCGYFDVSDMRNFMRTRSLEDCVAFSAFVKDFWKQSNQPK